MNYTSIHCQAKSSYIRQISILIGRGKVNSVSECGELRMGPHILPCPVLSTCSVRSTSTVPVPSPSVCATGPTRKICQILLLHIYY